MTKVNSRRQNLRPSKASRRRQRAFQISKIRRIRQAVCESFAEEEKNLFDTKKELERVKEQVVREKRFWKDQLANKNRWWNNKWEQREKQWRRDKHLAVEEGKQRLLEDRVGVIKEKEKAEREKEVVERENERLREKVLRLENQVGRLEDELVSSRHRVVVFK